MNTAKYSLRPLWDAILDVYKSFSAVCDAHGLRYFVTGGTALGAMRHKGFIPWDDDFDVIMPREDFMKFYLEYAKELPGHLRAEDFRVKENRMWPYVRSFGRIFETRSPVVHNVAKETGLGLGFGIFIDILPIDGMPRSKIPFYWWYFRYRFLEWLRFDHKRGFVAAIAHKAGRRILGFTGEPCEDVVRVEKWKSKWKFDFSPAADDINAPHERMKKRCFDKNTYLPARMVPFENIFVPVPNKVEYFLTCIYGDWHVLPPENSRVPTHQK